MNGKPDNDTAGGLHGVTLRYRFGLEVENYQILRATVLSVGADEPAKALSEGYLSGLALVNRGVDLAAGPGIIRHGKGIFALVDGGSSRYDTGSNIDVDSLSLLAGVSGVTPFSAGTLTLAGFLSYGRGDYDTYNSFANAASVKGQGGSDYTGLGALARFDFSGSDTGHPYAEAHFQGGRVKTDFYSGDLVDVLGRSARYDTSSNYYGAHIGAGYVRNIAGGGELDLYAKYLYARRGGDSVRLDSGDPVSFDYVNSHRLRVGGRYAWRANNLRPYVGLAWEYEFDGRANAAAYGYPIDAPDMEGDTGIVELGFTLTPSGTERLLIDLGVQAYTGQREGVSGNVKLEYMF